ncbi:hypothetical protein Tco_0090847 [Tanacetum coccineum]
MNNTDDVTHKAEINQMESDDQAILDPILSGLHEGHLCCIKVDSEMQFRKQGSSTMLENSNGPIMVIRDNGVTTAEDWFILLLKYTVRPLRMGSFLSSDSARFLTRRSRKLITLPIKEKH